MSPRTPVSEQDLRREIEDLKDRHPSLKDDELFALWFLLAFVTDDEKQARSALTGASGDKGVDALLIDDKAKQVVVVQSKFRQKLGKGGEGHAALMSFAALARKLTGDDADFRVLLQQANSSLAYVAPIARKQLTKSGYSLQLYYVTTGGVSKALVTQARDSVRGGPVKASLEVLDGHKVLLLLSDYLDGVAPPVPSLDIEVESGDGVQVGAPFERFDSKAGIDTWILSVRGSTIGELYERAGARLFARNVRGYLGGDTQINRGMSETIAATPGLFWYYNNGVTIICDDVAEVKREGKKVLTVTNPQVINGQQTTRTLHAAGKAAAKSAVLVRIIKVPRNPGDSEWEFERLVSKIVAATNWQNAIKASDLMANDRRQVEIERAFRKLGYLYVRKRQTKGEAKARSSIAFKFSVKKDELAQAVTACDIDPQLVREGKERLFEERWYGKVFPNSDPAYYLTRYWLVRVVGYGAKGKPERAYAKWLVANLLWDHLGPQLKGRVLLEEFRRMCEKSTHPIQMLNYSVGTAFQAAMALYRSERGTGESATDVSNFFKRKSLPAALDRFLRSARGKPLKTRLVKRMTRLITALKEAADRG
jgi:urease gamma subunit